MNTRMDLGSFEARLAFICRGTLGTGLGLAGGPSCPFTEGKPLWEGHP